VPDKARRINIGFVGGEVLPARVSPGELTRLRQALPPPDGTSLRPGDLSLDLSKASALVDHEGPRVGFGT
jgi:hypothetical protein